MLPGIPDPDTEIKTVFLSSVRLTHWFTKLLFAFDMTFALDRLLH